MDIPDIKDLAKRKGDIQIIVTFLDEDHITVAAKIITYGFGRPTYGDYVILNAEEHTEEKIKQAAEQLLTRLGT